MFDPSDHPHRRYDPLSDQWVLVSPHRTKRPWQGQQDAPDTAQLPQHDPACYLCPRNARVTGTTNPDYAGPFAFDNDFAALLPDTPVVADDHADSVLHRWQSARGTARVICFSPDHHRGLPDLTVPEVDAALGFMAAELAALSSHHVYVQLFENKGAMMGCSNPHPHAQIWATQHLPHLVATELQTQAQWFAAHGAPMLLMTAQEEADGPRVVVQHDRWMAIVPWWANWPYEVLLLPRFAVARLEDVGGDDRAALAACLHELVVRYDNLFQCRFPYSMGWHGAPHAIDAPGWQLHAHFYPPLLRSASVRKFSVGYEMLAELARDMTPEQAAAHLRAQPTRLYRA